MNKINFPDFQQSLSAEVVRTIQIIYFAIGSGATFFLAVVLFLYHRGLPSGPETAEAVYDLGTFTMIHGVMLVVALWLSGFLYNQACTEKRVRAVVENAGSDPGVIPGGILTVIRSARILKLAVIDGPAFFGLVICFLGVTGGVIYREPVYWVNLASYGVLVAAVYRDFPTKGKILAEAKSKMAYLFG